MAVFCGLPFGIAGINFSRVGEISRAISFESAIRNVENGLKKFQSGYINYEYA